MKKKDIEKGGLFGRCAAHTEILGVRLTRRADRELLKIKKELLSGRMPQRIIFTPNSLILLKASRSEADRRMLNRADLLLPDGAGVVMAARMMGEPIGRRITGIDTAEELIALAEKKGLSVFLLGGRQGVASLAARKLREKHPRLRIAGVHHGYFEKNGEENRKVVDMIRRAHPDMLFVCFGYPLQERWIAENRERLQDVKLLMGLGGSLDVWSGRVKRAPLLVRKLNLEWLWRCASDPKKLKDAASLPLFVLRLLLLSLS